jgi:fumarate hydratase subunit beta
MSTEAQETQNTGAEWTTGFRRLRTPLAEADIASLRAGDQVLLTGVLLTGRDAAHKRFAEALDRGERLPVDLAGQVLYYVGPSPARPGMPIGAAGPTTAGRMDSATPRLLALGLKATIGKGKRSAEVREALRRHNAVYFGAVGGLGALLARQIKRAEVVAYPDLGAEAVYRLEVEDFPLVVLDDTQGGDLYESAPAEWARDEPSADSGGAD